MNKILESFNAMSGIEDNEYVPEQDVEVMDVVDGELTPETPVEEVSYLGRYVAKCPVCAEPFFCNAEATIIEGMCHDVCPVCQEEVDAQVLGVVAPVEEEKPEEEGEEGEVTPEDGEEKPEEVDESKTPTEDGKVEETPLAVEGTAKACEGSEGDNKEEGEKKPSLEFDESSMNSLLSQFISENYKSMKSIKVERVVRKTGQLVIESKIIMKKGTEKRVNFVVENFRLTRAMKMEAKCEELGIPSKGICFEARLKSGAIIPESMSYDYITKVLSEGKLCKAQIVGSHKA